MCLNLSPQISGQRLSSKFFYHIWALGGPISPGNIHKAAVHLVTDAKTAAVLSLFNELGPADFHPSKVVSPIFQHMSDPMSQHASNQIHYLASQNAPLLKNLMFYHQCQTRFLSKLFGKIENRFLKLIEKEKDMFVNDITETWRRIHKLDRTLRGGHLPVWFRAKECQDELTNLLYLLAPYTKDRLNELEFRTRVRDAIEKDNANRAKTIENMIKKLQGNGRRFFGRSSADVESCFGDLLPEIKKLSDWHPEFYRLSTLRYLLGKFSKSTSMDPLMAALNAHITRKLGESSDVDTGVSSPPAHRVLQFIPPEVRVIRKPSGSIIAILLGPDLSQDDIHAKYCPEIQQLGKLPVLYTSKSHSECQGQFVVAQAAIEQRADSRRYVIWTKGDAPDIYLVEKNGGDAFILATRLGEDITKDVTVALSRDSQTVQDAIRFSSEKEWILKSGWEAYGMHGLRCNSQLFADYGHQIFVPGPPECATAVA